MVLRRPSPVVSVEPGSTAAIHQFLPALLPGDAVGMHTLQVRDAIRSTGLASDIFCEAIHPSLEGEARLHTEFRHYAKGSVMLYQLATGSVLADVVYARPEPLVVDYHNLTPPSYFRRWDPAVTNALSWGRAQLAMLAGRAVLSVADSAYNESELVDLGYRSTSVVPILLDFASMDDAVDEDTLKRLTDAKKGGGADLLFVGRIAPNKAQHDLVKALLAYRRLYDPRARLRLVGSPATDTYGDALARFIHAFGLDDAVETVSGLSHGELMAYYRAADVLVSTSEHEGFWVPGLEALHHGVPVVAYASTAVPDTLRGAALLLPEKSPATVAAAVHRVLTDGALRSRLAAGARARLDYFSLANTRRTLLKALAPIAGYDL